jgi:hypothetical protein
MVRAQLSADSIRLPSDRSYRSPAHSGGHFRHRDSLAAMKTAVTAATSAIMPMVSVSKSDANEAGNAVLRWCGVEPFVGGGKTLELLTPACNPSQHGSGDRTKSKLQETLISSA